jgi:hypothetical protein
MFNKNFVTDMIERAIKTFAQVVVSLTIIITPQTGFEILSINWVQVLLVASVSALISVFTSIASYNVGDKGTASLVK